MFLECYAGGVGLTLGFSEIDSVVVLDTPEAVQGWAHTQVRFWEGQHIMCCKWVG